MRTHLSSRARWAALTTAILTPALILTAAPAALAAPPTDGTVASGSDWSVATAPGGYVVTFELDEPLPIVSDAPTLVVDGETLGLAIESADGRSLSVTTADPRVASARDVDKGWASGDTDKAAEDPTLAPTDEPANDDLLRQMSRLAPLAATDEPSDLGAYAVTEAEYDFGDRAVALAGISGVRGEMTGKMYLTDAPGERPTVILLHGRHGSCATGTSNPLRWPCGENQVNVRSYQGYEGIGRALASHGYNVLSIAANAVNSNDNQLALDYGAQARGQLILDTLGMLEDANAAQPVAFDDISWPDADGAASTVTRTLDDALRHATTRADAPAPASGITAARLAGRFDLDHVGIMGHSRGGEGATSAVTLNQGLDDPYGIISVLPLAPVDFGRMTVPDVPLGVFLPYCDGDVSNQQGQHMIDDSRHAFGDDVLRSAVWIMGANHNFFNTVWTPGLYPYSTSDDWNSRDMTSSCSTQDSSRLTPAQQYQVGVSYMTGFFRLTMGGETQFQSLFDGSTVPQTPSTSFADVRVMASQPSSATSLVTDFASASNLVRTAGAASAQVCANSETATSIAPVVPYCTLRDIGGSRVPHWAPMRFGANVLATPVTRLLWTAGSDPAAPSTGELRVAVAAGMRDVSARTQLTVKMAPDRTVPTGTDVTISVIDGAGRVFTRPVSEINPHAVNRMPGGTHATLNKFVLQQVTIPVSEMTGIDLTDVREVRFTAGVGADATGAGGLYLSDLAFDTPTHSPAVVQTRTTVSVATTRVEEGSGPGTADIAVALSRPETAPVTAWVSVVGTGVVTAAVQQVAFAPGETCRVVTVPTNGDTLASAAASSAFTVSATNSTHAVMGASAFGTLIVREDDGVTGPVAEIPAVGVQGDVCAELAAANAPGELETSAADVAPGGTVTLRGAGFRVGEAVQFTLGDGEIETVIADGDGIAALEITVADDAVLGPQTVTARGQGSGRVLEATVSVLAPTTVELDLDTALVAGEPITAQATVAGAQTDGTVSLVVLEPGAATTDGAVDGTVARVSASAVAAAPGDVLATATVVDGTATLTVADGLAAGTYTLAARFEGSAVASPSQSAAVEVTVAAAPAGPGSGGGLPGVGAPAAGGPAGGPLASTGGVLPVTLIGAAIALVIGGAAVMVIRRRRAALTDGGPSED